jgi:peptide/nickel transport system substrate-binding protein
MNRSQSKLEELQRAISQGQLSRRDVLRQALALGLSAPVIAGLLAACGGDGDDTEDGGDEDTAEETEPAAGGEETESSEEPTEAVATAAETEAEATGTEAGEAATEGDATGTEDDPASTEAEGSASEGEWITSDVDPLTMGKEMEEPASQGGVLIQASGSDISTVNPVLSSDTTSGAVIAMIYEAMFVENPDTLEPVGHLAEAWQVTNDGLTWTMRLREGVTWQDGEPFTAQDVKFSYDLYMNPDSNSPRVSDLQSKIESIEVIDDLTITFTLTFANADFALDVANYGIIAEHIWQDVAPADVQNDPGSAGEDPARVVGTGPFMLQEWVVEDRTVLVRNENYWGGAPYLDQWIMRVTGDSTATLQALQTGDVDWGTVPQASVSDLDGTDVQVINYPTLNFTFYGGNLDAEKTTLFQDIEVRQALLYAMDREAMVEAILFGYGEVAVGTMPTLSWAYNPDGIEETYPYDPEKAAQLLDQAGWVMGDDGVRAKDGTPLAFEMYTTASNDIYPQYLVTFQEFWREIGIEMTPRPEPFPALVERITETFDFEAFLIGFSWGATPGQETMWACDSYPLGFNLVKYCNPELDEIMVEALSTLDRERRIELYTEMQNIVVVEQPMAVIAFPEGLIGLNNRVHNVFINDVNIRFNPHLWWVEQ